jgi:MoaA/NifB/PqqE/SkfB family radical SAM enzyme
MTEDVSQDRGAAQDGADGGKERKRRKNLRLLSVLDNRPRQGPQTVHFDIANACNTRCTTCWDHSPFLNADRVPTAAWKRRTLPLESFQATLDDLVALGGLEQIILSGMGEPFLNQAIYDMVAYAHARGVGVTIITNLLLADVPRLLSTRGQLNLLTSICGVTAPVWQAFHAHPKPRGFDGLIAQLTALADRGFRPKHVQVINNQNFHELVDMVHFARRFPVKRINFKFASLRNGTEAVALTPDQKSELRHDLVPRAMAFAHAFKIDTDLDAFCAQIDPDSDSTAPIADVGCFMGLLYSRLTVQGDVLYCCNTNVHVGKLSGPGSFRALWEGDDWQDLRDSVRAGRYFDGCEQCGKFKQNWKWSQKLRQSLAPADFDALLGRQT